MKTRLTAAIALFSLSHFLFADTVEVLTSLEPYRSIEINPIETGVISMIHVKKGQSVTKGDVLIELDTEITLSQLEIAQLQADNEGRIMAAQAERDLVTEKLERLKRMSSPSRAEIFREQATVKIAEGNLMTAEMERKSFELQVKQIQAQLKRRVLTTPINGTVTEITKDLAESVTPNQLREGEFLVQVVELDRLKAEAHVPAGPGRNLKVGQTLNLRIEQDSQIISGTIEFVSPVDNSATATVRIDLVIDNSERKLRSGSACYVQIETSE